jgi:hypothetical protein
MVIIKLDDWQKEFLETKGDKILCCGRQIGKSEICSIDAGEYAVKNKNKVVLMIAPTERQAFSLFEKTLFYLAENYKTMIKKGKDRPTKSKINLKNGTKIWCLPTGLSGLGIRFLTVHRLYVDECSRVPEEVFTAITPMLLTTGGDTIYLSTPAGREGTFADTFNNKDNAYKSFTRFSKSSEEVIKSRKICETWQEFQRDKALEHLQRERSRMTALQYAQEYEGELIDELRQFFPTDLIRSSMTLRSGFTGLTSPSLSSSFATPGFSSKYKKYLGVDVARHGEDETVLYAIEDRNGKGYEIDLKVFNKQYLTETTEDILSMDKAYNFKRIFIDDGGLGVGVYDPLLMHSQTKRKVEAINNSSRSITKDGTRSKRLLKEDLYNNLRAMMEQGKVHLKEDNDTFQSLKSIQAEYSGGKLRIFGNYSHITEALIRAFWGFRTKSLNIYIH